jgi:hypothetical protein
VARKGANRPIFEGGTPPKKMYSQYWRRYRRHNRNPVKTVRIIYLEYAKDIHLFLCFCTAWFLLVKNTRKILRKISYNRDPVNTQNIYTVG